MADETISVRSVTGVDMTMTIAGPGSRSYAFIIDWHIRFLIAAAWVLCARFLIGLSLKATSPDVLLSWIPALAVYLLYHPVLEIAMRGRSPGKRVAGVLVLDRQGGVPSSLAILIRNVFRIIDSAPVFYLIGLACCFFTAQRVRIGDLAAGTLLVIDPADNARVLSRLESLTGSSHLPLETLELIDQLLDRWKALQPDERRDIAAALLRRIDPPAAGGSEADMHRRLQALLADAAVPRA